MHKIALKSLVLSAALTVGALSAAAPAKAEIVRNDGSKQFTPASSTSRQQAYCKNGVSYTFTYNSDGTIATMSWSHDECVGAGG